MFKNGKPFILDGVVGGASGMRWLTIVFQIREVDMKRVKTNSLSFYLRKHDLFYLSLY